MPHSVDALGYGVLLVPAMASSKPTIMCSSHELWCNGMSLEPKLLEASVYTNCGSTNIKSGKYAITSGGATDSEKNRSIHSTGGYSLSLASPADG